MSKGMGVQELLSRLGTYEARYHYHQWWHLLTITSGPIYKCDCGAIKEPAPWWRFWNRSPVVKEEHL